jgi:DNA-binding CsgD family transcriptional regulator/tetratricopeptide (TPR) repeat protein
MLGQGFLQDVAAIVLFVDRARAVRPDFALSAGDAPAVAEICRRLDGLPLAIELAAALVDVQAPQTILDGMQRSGLDVLVGGPRDAPARHQTLRAAIEWSERLLSDEERAVFHRLAVFSGGCTLDAAEAVCGSNSGQRLDVRAALTSLVRKNLVRFEPGTGEQPGRYRLLEMMREYGLERLREAEQEIGLRARHLDWCLALGAAAEPELRGRHQKDWMDLLEQEHDNLRAALTWCQRTNRTTEGLRLCAALGQFWQVRGFFAEGNRWCAGFLQASAGAPSAARLWALIQAAWLANSSRQDLVGTYADEALQLARALGDKSGESWSLQHKARAGGMYIGDFDKARILAEEGLRTAQLAEDAACLRFSYFFLGQVARAQAKFDDAAGFYTRAVALTRQAGDSNNLVFTLANFGQLNFFRGHYEAAGVMYREALAAARDGSNRHGMSFCLSALPQLAQVLNCPERAARLLGVTEALRERLGVRTSPSRPAGDWDLTAARSELGDDRFDALLAEGRAMKLDDAIEYALAPDAPAIVGAPRVDDTLTPREVEVVALVAQGMSNRQIADKLVISTRTADRHVGNILSKLGLASRTQVATWALQHLSELHTHTPSS